MGDWVVPVGTCKKLLTDKLVVEALVTVNILLVVENVNDALLENVAGVPFVEDQKRTCPIVSAVVVPKYALNESVPAAVIAPPFKPVPPVTDVTVPSVVLHVAQATVIGDEPKTDAPAVTVITPEPDKVVVEVVCTVLNPEANKTPL